MRISRISLGRPNPNAIREDIEKSESIGWVFSTLEVLTDQAVWDIINPLHSLWSNYLRLDNQKELLIERALNAYSLSLLIEPSRAVFNRSLQRLRGKPRASIINATSYRRSDIPGPFGGIWSSASCELIASLIPQSACKKYFEHEVRCIDYDMQPKLQAFRTSTEPSVDCAKPFAFLAVDIYDGQHITYNQMYEAVLIFTEEVERATKRLNEITPQMVFQWCDENYEEIKKEQLACRILR